MSTYASFQGRVFLGKRDPAGLPIEVRSPGNVAELKLSLKTDVLEHFENRVKGFKNMLRVLKHGGVLYLALPEMQHSFDRIRRPTPFEHVWRDYEEGPAWSRRQAFEEFAEVFVENGMDKNLFPQSSGDARAEFTRRVADDLEREDFSIHFHAWRMPDMLEMFLQLHRRLHIGFRLELAQANGDEVIFIFRRTEFTIR